MTTRSIATDTLAVPGGRLYYEVRGSGPLVVLAGSPMDADAFAPLAELLATDHTVLTTDPRGINRSPLEDPEEESTPALRATDLAALIEHIDAGPGVVLGSSGGAVSALALLQARPDLLRTIVAHEPPLEELLDDVRARRTATDDIIATYRSEGSAAAWMKFLADANIEMDLEDDHSPQAPPQDPQQVTDERRFFLHELRATTRWVPDLDGLRSAAARIVVGIGEESTGQVCETTSEALAAALGIRSTRFPGGHVGFVEQPEAFAARLRAVLPGAR